MSKEMKNSTRTGIQEEAGRWDRAVERSPGREYRDSVGEDGAHCRGRLEGGRETECIVGEKWALVKEWVLEHGMPKTQSQISLELCNSW